MGALTPVALAAAAVLVAALAVLAIDWERLRAKARPAGRYARKVVRDDGWQGVARGLLLIGGMCLWSAACFTGLFVIARAVWGVA